MPAKATTAEYQAIVIGSGPNGLAAAVALAQAGQKVLLVEAAATLGGGTRTQALTLPGFQHDVCSAVHPMGAASRFFCHLPLSDLGLKWLQPPVALAHPLEQDGPALMRRSVAETAASLGRDGPAYQRLMEPLVAHGDELIDDLAGPLRWPRRPLLATRFGLLAVRSAAGLARSRFSTPAGQALWAGLAGHAVLPLTQASSAAVALMLAVAGHVYGWPFAAGGSQAITTALASYFRSLGGEVRLQTPVRHLDDLPAAERYFFDLTPRPLLAIGGLPLSPNLRRRLERYRYGPGVFKLDWALSAPVPWRQASCSQAGTVHLGGRLEDIIASEQAAWSGRISDAPYVLLTQPSIFDPSRAPPGKHTAWAYMHVPPGSQVDAATATSLIEKQVERFAPGFRDCILARHHLDPAAFESYNPNYVGGDIVGGVADLTQLLTRPIAQVNPYALGSKRYFLCSASTPPGAGVHGLCGYYAAKSAKL